MKKRIWLACRQAWPAILIFIFSLTACKENIEEKVKNKASEMKWNKDQAEVAYVATLRHLMIVEIDKGVFKINERRIKIEDALRRVKTALEGFDEILDNTNEDNWKYLKDNNLKSDFQRERLKYKIIYDRLQLIYLNDKFHELMGLAKTYESESHHHGHDDYGAVYRLRHLISNEEELAKYDFVGKVELLKKKFKEFQTVVYFINDDLAFKVKDLNSLEDQNRFFWKKIRRGLEIKTYRSASENIPWENSGEYIEATRLEILNDNGREFIKRETKPALRIFSSGYGKLNIVMLDADFEGEYGFGIPDKLLEVSGVVSGSVMNGNSLLKEEKIISLLFASKEKEELARREREPKEMKVEIVRAGENPVEEWEYASGENGWEVGFKYKDVQAGNYKVRVIYKINKLRNNEPDHQSSFNKKEIEAIVKEYYLPNNPVLSSIGAVVEYYRPLAPYDKKDILDAEAEGKKITIIREGEPAITSLIQNEKNIFIEDKPFRIDYAEGDQRWRLEDRKGNDGILESRKKISVSKY